MGRIKNIFYTAIVITFAVIFNAAAVDQSVSASMIEGKHVVVYYADGSDIAGINSRFGMSITDRILAGRLAKAVKSPEAELADSLDTLFLQVSDITDMHVYSLRINIKICRDYGELNSIYYNLFGSDLKETSSFYVADSNTIYISAENFRREIVGHEMAHAIISRYFLVPPPMKIQEVLAMYVEYCLRSNKR